MSIHMLPDQADLIGVALLGLPALTAVTVWRSPRRLTPWAELVAATVIAVGLTLFLYPVFAVPRASPPLHLMLIPLLSAVTLGLCVQQTWIRVSGALVGSVVAFALPLVWSRLVLVGSYKTGDHATGAAMRAQNRLQRLQQRRFLQAVSAGDPQPRTLPSGFLDDGWYRQKISPHLLLDSPPRLRLRHNHLTARWHSWLTDLYRAQVIPVGIWTPGGTPEEAARGLELRERTGAAN